VSSMKPKERQRLAIQAELDAEKSQAERNRMGQFATPEPLARAILQRARELLNGERVRFLDPALGTGAFFSALESTFEKERRLEAVGYEIDSHYGNAAAKLWKSHGLKLRLSDFTKAEPENRFNLVICNPPYVRHHHLDNEQKARLTEATYKASGMNLSGLAGLYCYFLGLTHRWLAPNALAGWLIPSEFMDVNYGMEVKRYLLERVTLLEIYRFDPNDSQFSDALVSSAIVWFRNSPPSKDHKVLFGYGGLPSSPELTRLVGVGDLTNESKWSRYPRKETRPLRNTPTVADYFRIKRGLATGDNSYFILSAEQINERKLPWEVFRPVLPSPRYLPEDEVNATEDGLPLVEKRLFLLDTKLSEPEIEVRFPALWSYLLQGKERGLHERYLCSHRSPWYSQEIRPPAPIVCTYLGRGDTQRARPFRFILNHSRATVTNVYLAMYPTETLSRALREDPDLLRGVWSFLREISSDDLLGEGRVYGGGLHKLEPKELGNVPLAFSSTVARSIDRRAEQPNLFTNHP
jgi:adenine-specific DNA-methyltransferase